MHKDTHTHTITLEHINIPAHTRAHTGSHPDAGTLESVHKPWRHKHTLAQTDTYTHLHKHTPTIQTQAHLNPYRHSPHTHRHTLILTQTQAHRNPKTHHLFTQTHTLYTHTIQTPAYPYKHTPVAVVGHLLHDLAVDLVLQGGMLCGRPEDLVRQLHGAAGVLDGVVAHVLQDG